MPLRSFIIRLWCCQARLRWMSCFSSALISTAEFDLLKVFLARPQRVLSRDQLLDLARGREAVAFDRAIDTLVSRLRRKLERDPKNPELIKTIWGGGYLFAADVSQE